MPYAPGSTVTDFAHPRNFWFSGTPSRVTPPHLHDDRHVLPVVWRLASVRGLRAFSLGWVLLVRCVGWQHANRKRW
jgi:hypothetical protein